MQNQPKAQEVLLEDQERINQFNRYHTKMRELEATLKEHKVRLPTVAWPRFQTRT